MKLNIGLVVQQKKRKLNVTAPSVTKIKGGTMFLSGILNKIVNMEPLVDEDGDEIDCESDDGSNFVIEEAAFVGGRGDNNLVDTEDDVDYIGDGWI